MSQLNDLLENHQQLDQMLSIAKHHGMNAQFLTQAILEKCEEQNKAEETEEKEKESEKSESASESEQSEGEMGLFVNDLKQFYARF